MRDWVGVPGLLSIADPATKDSIDRIDYFLRDLSRGLRRISNGLTPDGSGNTIINNDILSDLYWYKPGMSAGTHIAYGETAAGGQATVASTPHATKGKVNFGAARQTVYDEANERFGITQPTPTARLHIKVPNPAGQEPAMSSAAQTFGSGSAASSGTFLDCLDDTDTADWVRYTENGATSTITCEFEELIDPSVTTEHVITIVARASVTSGNFGWQISLKNDVGNTNILDLGSGRTHWDVGCQGTNGVDGTWDDRLVGTGFTVLTYTLSASEVAAIDYSDRLRLEMAYAGTLLSNLRTWDWAYVTFTAPAVGGGSAETLQKWENATFTNALDFAEDGSGVSNSFDLAMSGIGPLRLGVGDDSSALRTFASASAQYLEAGKSDQTNRNLTLRGNRASQGTLLYSYFATNRFSGTVQLEGATSGKLGQLAAATTTDYNVTWPSATTTGVLFNNGPGTTQWMATSALPVSGAATTLQHRFVANGPYQTDTDVDGGYSATKALTLSKVRLYRRSPGSSGQTRVDLLKNGVTVFSAVPTVTVAMGASATADGTLSVTAIAVGDKLTVSCLEKDVGAPLDYVLEVEGA